MNHTRRSYIGAIGALGLTNIAGCVSLTDDSGSIVDGYTVEFKPYSVVLTNESVQEDIFLGYPNVRLSPSVSQGDTVEVYFHEFNTIYNEVMADVELFRNLPNPFQNEEIASIQSNETVNITDQENQNALGSAQYTVHQSFDLYEYIFFFDQYDTSLLQLGLQIRTEDSIETEDTEFDPEQYTELQQIYIDEKTLGLIQNIDVFEDSSASFYSAPVFVPEQTYVLSIAGNTAAQTISETSLLFSEEYRSSNVKKRSPQEYTDNLLEEQFTDEFCSEAERMSLAENQGELEEDIVTVEFNRENITTISNLEERDLQGMYHTVLDETNTITSSSVTFTATQQGIDSAILKEERRSRVKKDLYSSLETDSESIDEVVEEYDLRDIQPVVEYNVVRLPSYYPFEMYNLYICDTQLYLEDVEYKLQFERDPSTFEDVYTEKTQIVSTDRYD